MKTLAKLLILLMGTVTLLTGCCTKALWQAEAFNNHFEPAPTANAALFRKQGTDEVLVVYDEEKETSGKVRRRAYWLKANERRVAHRQKPQFVALKKAAGLVEIPWGKAETTNAARAAWAELNARGTGFKLVEKGGSHDYIFPVYRDKTDDVEGILLMPGTLTADTALAAGTLGIYYLYFGAPGVSR